ncbi:peptide chain release factor N(5)-glutamine methyltransferase [Pseudofrankia inefficax]|uniref:Release factor glutamine methyltransferase n=1 Tax=Pseudofrankia inefficax (strain DSM 45817 / CECT 9037 / DDB 130130 / EuI1c) TaxID=298654 RepID=E3IXI5_PSEI1|nr:peptide chain release factor N(5)-glutamine methyltransferase [Pseudofrankia inefficax]ADP79002.1 protein-(glutamine-N5) methyltransferase, release factor-specific [Pseudofrankia inefficax]
MPPPTSRHAWPGTPTATDRLLTAELAAATRRLEAAGVASPRTDAQLLAAHVLGVPRGRLPLVREVPADVLDRFWDLVGRRAGRAPLQHLTGEAYFRHLTLAVGPGVFVPRPETEAVVGWAIDTLAAEASSMPAERPGPVCVDLCAGSGAIALALADEVAGAEVHAVEADPAALTYLRRNVAATGPPVRVHAADVLGIPTGYGPVGAWAQVPVLDGLAGLVGRVDAVVSNPPYLPDADRAVVEPEVGRHDPPWALWGGGGDGLAGPRAVAAAAAALLRPGGLFAMEHADGQGAAIRALLAAAGGWSEIATRRDLAGRDRFVTARR